MGEVWKGRTHGTELTAKPIELTGQKSVANTFNSFFANTGSDLASAIHCVNKTAHQYMSSLSCGIFSCHRYYRGYIT